MDKGELITVDSYISTFPPETQELLKLLRNTIKNAAPDAIEVISYRMPAFKYKGMLAYFAVHQRHIGFYPMTAPIANFKNELVGFKTSKGTVQFPLDKDLPIELIERMIKFQVHRNEEKALLKSKSQAK